MLPAEAPVAATSSSGARSEPGCTLSARCFLRCRSNAQLNPASYAPRLMPPLIVIT